MPRPEVASATRTLLEVLRLSTAYLTEHGSASKYADLFDFDVLELDSYDPLRLIEIIDYGTRTTKTW